VGGAPGTLPGCHRHSGSSADRERRRRRSKAKQKEKGKQQEEKEKDKEKDKKKVQQGKPKKGKRNEKDDDENDENDKDELNFFTGFRLGRRQGQPEEHQWRCFFLHGCLVASWSRRQATVALSPAEAELNALTTGLAEAMFIKNFMLEVSGREVDIKVHTDSSAAKAIATRTGVTPRAKHLSIKAFFAQHLLHEWRRPHP
jgi:hypothetical protein